MKNICQRKIIVHTQIKTDSKIHLGLPNYRGVSRTATISKMKHSVIIVNGCTGNLR